MGNGNTIFIYFIGILSESETLAHSECVTYVIKQFNKMPKFVRTQDGNFNDWRISFSISSTTVWLVLSSAKLNRLNSYFIVVKFDLHRKWCRHLWTVLIHEVTANGRSHQFGRDLLDWIPNKKWRSFRESENWGFSNGDSTCDIFINLIDLWRFVSLMNVRLRFWLKCRSRIWLVIDWNHL